MLPIAKRFPSPLPNNTAALRMLGVALLCAVAAYACNANKAKGRATSNDETAGGKESTAGAAALPSALAPRHEIAEKKAVLEAFRATDTDSDGKVTREETRQFGEKNFASLDSNGDGKLEPSEMLASLEKVMTPALEKQISAWDKNKDGKVSRDELPTPLQAKFDQLDHTKDGWLTVEDLLAARRPMLLQMSPIAVLDTDGDGDVTMQEYMQASVQWFARADTNKDDRVTLEEAELAVPSARERALQQLRKQPRSAP